MTTSNNNKKLSGQSNVDEAQFIDSQGLVYHVKNLMTTKLSFDMDSLKKSTLYNTGVRFFLSVVHIEEKIIIRHEQR